MTSNFILLHLIVAVLLTCVSAGAAETLSEIAADFAILKKHQPKLTPDIDAQRFIDTNTWHEAYSSNAIPWLAYGSTAYNGWIEAAQWVADGADNLPLTIELYDRLEKIALRHHYYRGYEVRRIQAAMNDGKLPLNIGQQLLDKIELGEEIYYSGTDHSKLPATFRQDPLDEFQHNGESFFLDGTRFLTEEEIRNAQKNPLLRFDKKTFIEVEKGHYLGTIYYPAIKDLESLVKQSLAKFNTKLPVLNSLEQKVKAILDFQIELMTIHRSLDGNGRVIRLLSDLLFLRIGLPPPAYPIQNDIFGNPDDIYQKTVKAMKSYLRKLQHRQWKPQQPEILFHWSTKGSYEWMLEHRHSKSEAPMQTIDKNSNFAKDFPQLANRTGTHAWTNPLKAMYGGRFDDGKIEWYVKPNKVPILIAYFLKPNLKIKTVRTVSEVTKTSNIKFDSIDLVYHQHLAKNGQVIYHEWILLNPDAVEKWSSNPSDLAPYIDQEREKIRRLKMDYPEMDRHFIESFNETKYSIMKSRKIVDTFISNGKSCENTLSDLPAHF